jgi:DNA repair protein RecO (recombination protein O)
MSRDDRNRIVDVLLTYYKMHVPNFPELRSLAVVKQLFEDK